MLAGKLSGTSSGLYSPLTLAAGNTFAMFNLVPTVNFVFLFLSLQTAPMIC